MEVIEMFFEMMIKYQQAKYRLKCDYEVLRVSLRLYYAKRIKDIHIKN